MKKTNQKGITLIALIITIIVMLILVGVTINVALNGGLFQKAKVAADGTQKQAEKEELMAAAFGTVDTKGDLQITKIALESVLSQGWEIDDENTFTDNNNQIWYTCTSPKGNTYYLNTTTGEIKETEPTSNPNPSGTFTWSSVNLEGVDTSAEYVFEQAGLTMTFSPQGICTITDGSTVNDPVDATDSTKYTITDGQFTYNSSYFGTVKLSVNQYGDIDANISGEGSFPAPPGTYPFEKNSVVGNYVYYNYDGNHPNSIWYVVGKESNGQINIISTEAMGNITLTETSPAVGAIEEWNNVPEKIESALGLIKENTFCNNVRSNISYGSGTENYTIESTEYTINTYGDLQNLYDYGNSTTCPFTKSGNYLINLFIDSSDTCKIGYYNTETGMAGTRSYYNINSNSVINLDDFGINIVVTLNTGVTLDKTSGDGTYASPYGLTNSGT